MNEIVGAVIAEELAKLVRIVPTPVEPFGFGVDSDGVTNLKDTLDDLDPFTPLCVAQACVRRLLTRRGQLLDDLDYGCDVRTYLNRAMPASELRQIPGAIRNELTKDDRVDDVSATAEMPDLRTLNIHVNVTPANPRTGGPFAFTLAVTDGEVLLEVLRAQ